MLNTARSMPMERTVRPCMDGHISEYVFDTATNFGLSAVVLLLFIGQGLVAVAFLANLVMDVPG